MAADSKAHVRWRSPDSVPNVVWPSNKRIRLHDAEVVSVDAATSVLMVKRKGMGRDGIVQVKLKPFARIVRNEIPIKSDELKAGEHVAVDFYLDDYIDAAHAAERELEAPEWST
jgi:hypothetical protein